MQTTTVELSVAIHPRYIGPELTQHVYGKLVDQLLGKFVSAEERVEQIYKVVLLTQHDCSCHAESGFVQIPIKCQLKTRSFRVGTRHDAVVETVTRHSVFVLIETNADHSVDSDVACMLRFVILVQDLSSAGKSENEYFYTDRKSHGLFRNCPMFEHRSNSALNLCKDVRVQVEIKQTNVSTSSDVIGTVRLISVVV